MINSSKSGNNCSSALRNRAMQTHLHLFHAVGVVAAFMQRALAGVPHTSFTPRRKVLDFEETFEASPEEVFPLLCPVREYDWIEDWDCTVVYSRSGFAEKGCVFTSQLALGETWTCSRYEPDSAIEFVINAGNNLVITFEASLEARSDATHVRWRRTFVTLDAIGNRFLDSYTQEKYDAEMAHLSRMLGHYLATGTCLRTGKPLVGEPRAKRAT